MGERLMAYDETVAGTTAPGRGRPRSERSRQAILHAVNELMLDRDLSEISMEAVAARAGASKATIYRWWPSKELLVLEALRGDWETTVPEAPDTGSLAGDLRALMLPWTRELAAKPYGRVIAALVARAQADAEFAGEYRTRFVEARRAHGRVAFNRAIGRSEIPEDTDIEVALDLLYGPVYHRILHGHAAVTEGFANTLVDYVLAAVSSPSGKVR
jgi:AcrR family transcriptional regulator